MATSLEQHNVEIQENLRAWEKKPLLQRIYRDFYKKIAQLVDQSIEGRVLEIGSGIGNMKGEIPDAISSDLFPNPWIDLVCDGYDLPFQDNSLSHIILFDVFHHLEAPAAFLEEARRALKPRGRIIIFDPFISLASLPVYGCLHHEPVGLRAKINLAKELPAPRAYYAAQGNATRLFFQGQHAGWMEGWSMFHAEAFARFSYLFSGGFSKPAMYPAGCYPLLKGIDALLSFAPSLFGARCLVGLTPRTGEQHRWRSTGF